MHEHAKGAVTATRRMRIEHGRVMHAVEERHGRIESLCKKRDKYGKESRRASGPPDWWTDKRFWYPDCKHCPKDESASQEGGIDTHA